MNMKRSNPVITNLSTHWYNNTKISVGNCSHYSLCGQQALVVPAKPRLENPVTRENGGKGVREEIFFMAGPALRTKMHETAKLILSDNRAFGDEMKFAFRMKTKEGIVLEHGSVVQTASYRIFEKSNEETSYLLHAVMLTGRKDWRFNNSAIIKSIKNCLGAAVELSIKRIGISVAPSKNNEMSLRDKMSAFSIATSDFLSGDKGGGQLGSIFFHLPDYLEMGKRKELVEIFNQNMRLLTRRNK